LRNMGLNLHVDQTGIVEVADLLALLALDRLAEKLEVQIVADGLHVAVLLAAENVARAADLQIAHRNLEAGAELRELADRREALLGNLGEHLVAREREIRIRAAARAAHTAADLVQLRQ